MIPFNKEILVALRKENNYTQESLANEVGVSRSLISSWENGKAIPNEEDIKRLNSIFHTTLYYEEETVETKPIAEHQNYLILICNYGIILLLFFLEWHMQPFGLICALTNYLYVRQEKLPKWVQLLMVCFVIYECYSIFSFFHPTVPLGWIEIPSHRVNP